MIFWCKKFNISSLRSGVFRFGVMAIALHWQMLSQMTWKMANGRGLVDGESWHRYMGFGRKVRNVIEGLFRAKIGDFTKMRTCVPHLGRPSILQKGIREQQELGAFLRRRYVDSGFLSQKYNESEVRLFSIKLRLLNQKPRSWQIYVISTNTSRTRFSATANLAGMYPNEAAVYKTNLVHVEAVKTPVSSPGFWVTSVEQRLLVYHRFFTEFHAGSRTKQSGRSTNQRRLKKSTTTAFSCCWEMGRD